MKVSFTGDSDEPVYLAVTQGMSEFFPFVGSLL